MQIFDYVSRDEFQELQNLFSEATGLAAIAAGSDEEFITEGSGLSDYWVKFLKLKRDMLMSLNGPVDTGGGLMVFAYDMTINGEKVGKVIGGLAMSQEPDEESLKNAAREHRLDPDTFYSEAKRLPQRKENTVRSSGELLSNAMNQVGVFYDRGWEVKVDRKMAFEWFQKAADAGNKDSIKRLNNINSNFQHEKHL